MAKGVLADGTDAADTRSARLRATSRRALLQGAALLAAAPVGAFASRVLAGSTGSPGPFEICTADGLVQAGDTPVASVRTLKLAWNPNAVCISPVVVAQHKGFFGWRKLAMTPLSRADARHPRRSSP